MLGMMTVILVGLATTATEALGVVLMYPILELIQSSESPEILAETSQFFRHAYDFFTFLGLQINLLNLILATGFVVVIRQALILFNHVYRAYFTYSAVEYMTSQTFSAFTFANSEFTERLRSGTLLNALFTESKRASTLLLAVLNFISGLIKLLVFTVILLSLSWQSTLIGGVSLALVVIAMSRDAIRGSKKTGKILNLANDRVTRYASERTGMFRLIKVSSTEPFECELFRGEMKNLKNLQVDLARHTAKIQAFIEPTAIFMALILLYLAIEVLHFGLAGLGVFLLVLFRMLPVVQQLAVNWQQIASCNASLNYIEALTRNAAAARDVDNGIKPFPHLTKGIQFEGVSYAYPARNGDNEKVEAITDVSLFIPAGSTTALLGPSGAGKSTLMDLIPRLRVPDAGKIFFDDIPAEDISLTSLRNSIALVSQESLMIDGTIAENLRYGNPDKTDDELRAAATAAFADQFIDQLPAGYETMLGERGILLSGGQRQRIALARALLADVPILLLDEPTSALDAESEHAVQEAVANIQAEHRTTVLIIAHRLSTVRNADQLIVLDNKTVLGAGTHNSLLDSLPSYRRIVELQTGEKISEIVS